MNQTFCCSHHLWFGPMNLYKTSNTFFLTAVLRNFNILHKVHISHSSHHRSAIFRQWNHCFFVISLNTAEEGEMKAQWLQNTTYCYVTSPCFSRDRHQHCYDKWGVILMCHHQLHTILLCAHTCLYHTLIKLVCPFKRLSLTFALKFKSPSKCKQKFIRTSLWLYNSSQSVCQKVRWFYVRASLDTKKLPPPIKYHQCVKSCNTLKINVAHKRA